MNRIGALALLLLASTPALAFDTSSLWRTPDQRADQLLSKGDAAAAAKTYQDPRRRAYAEAKAGDHAAAARDLAKLDDADAHYNRGNALARSGDLKGALAAYDQALQRNPRNADAQHNRDVVAKALEQPKQQDPKAGDNQGGDQKDRGDRTDQKQDPGQQGSDSGQAGGASQDQQGQKPQDGSQSGQQQAQDRSKSSPDGSNAKDDQTRDASQGQDRAQRDPASAGQPPQSESEEAEQAKRDAQAALASQQDAAKGDATASEQDATPAGDAAHEGSARGAASQPQRTEAQLAQEQWLRRIPDDPGGLLRRKFEIEHQRRQQEKGGTGEDTP